MPSESTNLTLCVLRSSALSSTPSVEQRNALIIGSEVPKTSEENTVLICVDRFGFSANNITYQALGDAPHFRYFDFHAVPETEKTSGRTHGLIPVWGFGTVVGTSHKHLEIGERVYGYFAPTRYLLLPISPKDVNKYSFFVSRPHFPRDRRPYNQIIRCKNDPQYNPSPEIEDLTMLYRPLFWTSFWCEDWLAMSNFRGGANNFLISSASAKTAFCLAYLIRERFKKSHGPLRIVGVTSKKNIAFTRFLKLYDTVVEYADISNFGKAQPSQSLQKWIYVDVAGNDEVNDNIRSLFFAASNTILIAHISLGLTNLSPNASTTGSESWSENTHLLDVTNSPSDSHLSSPEIQGSSLPAVESFFMPEWLAIRRTQLTVSQITEMQGDAWAALLQNCRPWVQIERINGGERVKYAYEQAVCNGLGPEKGYIWSMWEGQNTKKTACAKL